jgi:hypothetical protein
MSAPNPTPKTPVIDYYLSSSELSSSDNEEDMKKKEHGSPLKSETSKSTAFHIDDKNVIVSLQEHGQGFISEYCST